MGENDTLNLLSLHLPIHFLYFNFTLKELRRYNSRIVVRCCEPTYSTDQLASEGIMVVVSCCWC